MADIVPTANAVQPETSYRKQPGVYSVVWKGEDGEHTSITTYAGGWNDDRAEWWIRHKHPNLEIISITRSSEDEHATLVAKNLEKYASRTPIDEKTNGQPNRVLSDASLLKDE